MKILTILLIPLLFYLTLLACLFTGVMGVLRKSTWYLGVSTVLGVVVSVASMWSIGLYLSILPLVTVVILACFLVARFRKRSF